MTRFICILPLFASLVVPACDGVDDPGASVHIEGIDEPDDAPQHAEDIDEVHHQMQFDLVDPAESAWDACKGQPASICDLTSSCTWDGSCKRCNQPVCFDSEGRPKSKSY